MGLGADVVDVGGSNSFFSMDAVLVRRRTILWMDLPTR